MSIVDQKRFEAVMDGLFIEMVDTIEIIHTQDLPITARAAMATHLASNLVAYATTALMAAGFCGSSNQATAHVCMQIAEMVCRSAEAAEAEEQEETSVH